MGFREVSVVEVKEVLRGWLEGSGLRTVAERAGVDRKTARRYVAAAQAAGLTLAEIVDVVSARDLRTFYLPEFEQLRIPQWAARAEYYFGDTHAELVWIPVPSYDRIGKPGAEFYVLFDAGPGHVVEIDQADIQAP